VSDYFDLSPGGEMTIVKSGRTVLNTAGRLITGLPAANDYATTLTLTYPDVPKDWASYWQWQSHYVGSGGTVFNESDQGQAFITATAQEWSQTTDLGAIPSSLCNFFWPRVRINRTVAPNATWDGKTLIVQTITNQYMAYTGSVILEQAVGFARAFSLYIDGSSHLILHQQQSVTVPPGGWSSFGSAFPPNHTGDVRGGEWVCGTKSGYLVYDKGFLNSTTQITLASSTFAPTVQQDHRRAGIYGTGGASNGATTGASAVSISDPTNYGATYTVDILAGKFCRAT
jgi:hypothetical protein